MKKQDYATKKDLNSLYTFIVFALIIVMLTLAGFLSTGFDKINSKLDTIPHKVCWNETQYSLDGQCWYQKEGKYILNKLNNVSEIKYEVEFDNFNNPASIRLINADENKVIPECEIKQVERCEVK